MRHWYAERIDCNDFHTERKLSYVIILVPTTSIIARTYFTGAVHWPHIEIEKVKDTERLGMEMKG